MSAEAGPKPPILKATAENIRRAAAALRAGRLVVFPTETVYGLGGDATNKDAVARIFAAKGRPDFNPLISHVCDLEKAREIGVFNDAATALAKAFWPGPLTLVVPRSENSPVARLATAGLDTIAIRVPAHPVARALLEQSGIPLAAPSANVSGRISPTRASHVTGLKGGHVELILDGGPCQVGVESTIVLCTAGNPRILRPGGIPSEEFMQILGILGIPEQTEPDKTVISPGQLASHYAPKAALRLNAKTVKPGEGLLAFGPHLPADADRAALTCNLSQAADLREAAANLFDCLHALDRANLTTIAVMAVPETGLGIAINDRLRRAAAPRD
ncbi:MAG: threonylcarbamoyl-AMP synthase [Fimbriimonadaceae bacterium]|nr:threonylcarbamoyl-AMP synthase [Alphaproteobacteria bacterium]